MWRLQRPRLLDKIGLQGHSRLASRGAGGARRRPAAALARARAPHASALLSAVPPAAEQLTCQGVAALAKTAFDYANRAAEVIIKDPKKKYRAGDAGREGEAVIP